MRMMALRTLERPRQQDLSQPHKGSLENIAKAEVTSEDNGLENIVKAKATSEDDGLENIGKAEATRSMSATQRWPLEHHKG